MTEKQYLETIIDYEILDKVKAGTRCTKYVKKYSTEFRLAIYLIRKHHELSYRKIIAYCQDRYDESPSVGHIKKLIDDGRTELNGEGVLQNIQNPGESPDIKNIQKDISVNNKGGFTIQSTESEREIKFNRRCELKAKMINNDVMTLTLAERRELWDLTTVGPAVAEYYMEMLNSQYRTNKRFINIL